MSVKLRTTSPYDWYIEKADCSGNFTVRRATWPPGNYAQWWKNNTITKEKKKEEHLPEELFEI